MEKKGAGYYVSKGTDHTRIPPLSRQQQAGNPPPPCISLTNDRDAMPRRSQTAIWLRSRHVSDLHLNHALIASDDFLTKKKKEKEKQGQDTVGLNLEAPPHTHPTPPLPHTPHPTTTTSSLSLP